LACECADDIEPSMTEVNCCAKCGQKTKPIILGLCIKCWSDKHSVAQRLLQIEGESC